MISKSSNISQASNPREKANWLSILFFWWVNPLLIFGFKNEIKVENIYKVLSGDHSSLLGDLLESAWNEQIKKSSKNGRKPSLLQALIKMFWFRYSILGIIILFEECVTKIIQVVLMIKLMKYFSSQDSDTPVTLYEAYWYTAGILISNILYPLVHHIYFFHLMHTGMQMRIACCSIIYRKALRISQASLGKNTIGQIVNLLSNDVNRFDMATLFPHYLWIGPAQLIIVLYLTYGSIGYSAFVGGLLILLMIPLQSWVGRRLSHFRKHTAKGMDKRITIMNEIINCMRLIKMHAWEKPFSNLLKDARKAEIDVIRRAGYFRSFNLSFFFFSSRLILLATFLTFILDGGILTAEKAFYTLALFNSVRLSMTLFFPTAIAMNSEVMVSIKRIENFLLEESFSITCSPSEHFEKSGIKLKDISANWNTIPSAPSNLQTDNNILKSISLSINPGKLTAIIGPVGSGKSSLLMAVLGELPLTKGIVEVNGKISFISQQAWIFSGSIKDNILFDHPYNESRYNKVIEACALSHDIKQLEFGNETLVGDRGVSLSGGQKARIGLARGIYNEADIYLIDDPLSAVDTHVGRHLFDCCIKGFLKDKTVILVTHQLQYLRETENVYIMNNGVIEACESVNEMLDTHTLQHQSNHHDDVQEKFNTSSSDVQEKIPIGSLLNNLENDKYKDINTDFNKMDVKVNNSIKKPTQIEESQEEGNVRFKHYIKFFMAGGTWIAPILILITNIIAQTSYTFSDVWIDLWTRERDFVISTKNFSSDHQPIITLKDFEKEKAYLNENDSFVSSETENLMIFGIIVIILIITSSFRIFYFFIVCLKSSQNMHNNMFEKIMRSPPRFFDVNPIGRILNRFSKDIGSVDELLPLAMIDAIAIFWIVIGVVVVVCYVQPLILVPTFVVVLIFLFLRRFYMKSSRAIKRIEGVTRSPIFSQLSTTLNGIVTIRACGAQNLLIVEFDRLQDIHTSAWFAFIASSRWFGVWLDWITCFYLILCVISFITIDQDSMGGDVGLVISSCLSLTGCLQWGMRQSAEVENMMVSVERIFEYGKLKSEASLETSKTIKIPSKWPHKGQLHFKDVSLKYAEDEKLILKSLNFETKPGEKIGIVGRTGAGKSSIVTALFRMAEPKGQIFLDGINICEIGLHDVRKNITIIPQDPQLFTGTLRKNLDPFDQYSDSEVWNAFEKAHMLTAIKEMSNGIYTNINEGGSNLSVGQRQQVCLARAVLKQNKIIVLDEATANVDQITDGLIQQTIRDCFKHCTILTIAHRLHTVMDSDRILVMSDGSVKEFDEPYILLKNSDGYLTNLVNETGSSLRAELVFLAEKAHLARSTSSMRELLPNKDDGSLPDAC